MAADPHAPPLSGRRRTWAFSVVAIAFVMDLLDVTIVNVALPSIGQALGAGAAHSAWIVAGYALAFAVLLVLGGRLGDLLGHRRLFLWGVAAFTAASLACGLAPGAELRELRQHAPLVRDGEIFETHRANPANPSPSPAMLRRCNRAG